MKHIIKRGLLLTALIMGLAFHLTAQSTQMTIYLNDGNEKSYLMTPSDRVYFEDNETLVVEITVNTSLFPNPVHDVVMLSNLKGNETIQIFALDGRLMKSVEASEGQLIDISELPIGLYLVKTEHQTLKMIKL